MAVTELIELHANGADRVREHTAPGVLRDLDRELVARVSRYAERLDTADGKDALDARIAELEQESDIERNLEMNAAVVAFIGTALAGLHHRRWLVVPAVVTAFLFQHAVQGWCPPMAVFRRLGIRTRQEIDAERFALKALRGDLELPPHAAGAGDPVARARVMLAAVAR